jgi:opacity protein-like surface antigen
MMRFLRSAIVVILISIPSFARAQEEAFRRVTVSAGAGLTAITGDSAGELSRGGNFQLNGGYFFNQHFGITGNFMFSGLGITQAALDSLNETDGSASVYAVTVDPKVRLALRRRFSIYALAGGGYLRRTLHFHAPGLVAVGRKNMPFMLMPGSVLTDRIIDNSGGFDVGGGLDIPYPWSPLKIFAEVRYFKGFTNNTYTTVIPITFGIRW